MQFLTRLLSKKHRFSGEISPDQSFIAVGDLHGRADLLARLMDQIAAGPHADLPVIFVGDYVDRGEQSAQVLRAVKDLQDARDDVICLLGNHEQMMLNFLEDPVQHGARWLRYGGLQTLASLGVPIVGQTASDDEWLASRDACAAALGNDMIQWLYALPCKWVTGNVAVVHAGADPARDIMMQDDQVLIWGHRKFDEEDRTDGVWVVHGHTIVDNAIAENGRISIDTGAYATGTLSAAIVQPKDISFLIA